MANKGNDVVIAGAGVVGTALAYILAKAGLGVTVIDGNALGSGASLHGTGMVWKLIWERPPSIQACQGKHGTNEQACSRNP